MSPMPVIYNESDEGLQVPITYTSSKVGITFHPCIVDFKVCKPELFQLGLRPSVM